MTSGPEDVTIDCGDIPAAITLTATDACNGDIIAELSETRTEGDCSNNYTLVRIWTATDACGNASSTSQVITVQDSEAPVLVGVPDSDAAVCTDIQTQQLYSYR